MTNHALKSGVTLLTLALGLGLAPARTGAAAAEPAAEPSEFDQFVTKSKKPADWFTWGADVRLRNEYLNNGFSLSKDGVNNEQDYFRFRERIYGSFVPVTDLSLNWRFSGEQRWWMKPSLAGQYGPRSGFEERYGILDVANLKWNNILDQPLSITAGRQDLAFGDFYDWWLVLDGTPGDGSWTFFLDSIRATYEAKDIQTKFDAIYIYQNAAPDEWIPTLGRSSESLDHLGRARPYYLTEQNEQGVVVYASNKTLKNHQFDGYFIYKRDSRTRENMAYYSSGDNADIFTVGAKVTGDIVENLKYSVEGAYQFGTKEDSLYEGPVRRFAERDISAFGAKAKVAYQLKDKLNNQPYLFYEFLSGDDPETTDEDEMFDVLWGRWPRWSELYIYSYILETSGKVAQMNNIHRIGAGWSLAPMKGMSFLANYSALFAHEEVPTRTVAPTLFTGDGSFRGHYLQAVLRHTFNKHVSGHLWGEFIWMGDYYANRDLMSFLRAELLFTW